jgi:hypothetical protein
MESVIRSLTQFDAYLGDHLTSFWMYRIAELLNPRTFATISRADKTIAIDVMKKLCTSEETILPAEREAAALRVRVSRPIARVYPRAQQSATDVLSDELDRGVASTILPLTEELKVFLNEIAKAASKKDGVLVFWTAWGDKLPILFRIARRILASPACSTDVERLFSVTGFICSPLRAGLAPRVVNTLATMNLWLKEDHQYKNKRTDSINW